MTTYGITRWFKPLISYSVLQFTFKKQNKTATTNTHNTVTSVISLVTEQTIVITAQVEDICGLLYGLCQVAPVRAEAATELGLWRGPSQEAPRLAHPVATLD